MKKNIISVLYGLSILILIASLANIASAEILPYHITGKSFEVDGSSYWDNGIKTPRTPIYQYQSGSIKDYNGMVYSSRSDGLYQIDYDGRTTFFGFGISGTVNSNPFVRLSTDFPWMMSMVDNGDGYTVATRTTGNEWATEFDFTSRGTKITNSITNTLANPITNGKFYYLFTVNSGDAIKYNGSTYIVPSDPNLHISGNLNENIPKIVINDYVLFNFQDIINSGFDITDVYVVPASSLGFSSFYNVVAVGFTKGSGVLPVGATVTIDPSLEQNGGSTTLYGNQTYDFVNITNGGIVYVAAYNGTAGTGELTLNVTYDLTVDSTSSINGSIKGYRGGSGGTAYDGGYGGELAGFGGGQNGGGSNCNGAGGGGYATNGGQGGTGCAAGASGGSAQGTISGPDIQKGNGAGGGGSYNVAGQAGQAGGAMIKLIVGRNLNISGTVVANGGPGGNAGSNGGYASGGGAGASGGGILINGTNVNLSLSTISATGGLGGNGASGGTQGGSGSGGRIKIFYRGTLTNTSSTVSGGSIYYNQTSNTLPTAPTLTSDLTDHETNHTPQINFTKGTDENGDTVTTYIYVDGVLETTTTESYALLGSTNPLVDGTTYNVSARSWDGIGWSESNSSTDTFSMNTAPSIPILSTPANNSIFDNTSVVNFVWTASTDDQGDTVTYDLKINGTVNASNVSYTDTNITMPEGTHNWTVRSYDGYEYSAYAPLQDFSISLIPDIITDPDCTSHGATWAICTWNDATAPSFDHVYLTNYTGFNSSWDSNVSAGVQSKTFTGFSKGTYNFSAQTVSNLGSISSNRTWLNFTVNDYNFTFSNKSISSTSIVATTGAATISVKINDSDGNITGATVLISYMAIPFSYDMTNGSNDSWSFSFSSANSGLYQITGFNAIDDMGDVNFSSWNQTFTITASPVVGGNSGGGGTAPTSTPKINSSVPKGFKEFNINIKTMRNDPTGRLILQALVIIGILAFVKGLNKGSSDGLLVVGVIFFGIGFWGLGWVW